MGTAMTRSLRGRTPGSGKGSFKPGFLNDLLSKAIREKVTLKKRVIKDGKEVEEEFIVEAGEAIAHKIVERAVRGDGWAIDFVWTRLEGKPSQNLNVNGHLEVPQSLADLIMRGLEYGDGGSPMVPELGRGEDGEKVINLQEKAG